MAEVVLGPLYLFLAFFPALFPKQADNLMDGNPIDYEAPLNVDNSLVITTDHQFNSKDEQVLNNLDRMVNQTTNPQAKQMWFIKRQEFLRQMKWAKERSLTNGSERRAYHG